jgi:hypothetical protein
MQKDVTYDKLNDVTYDKRNFIPFYDERDHLGRLISYNVF